MPKAKEETTSASKSNPEDSSREKIVRELAFHVMVERGLADSETGRRRDSGDTILIFD
jgi:hypothetical protein